MKCHLGLARSPVGHPVARQWKADQLSTSPRAGAPATELARRRDELVAAMHAVGEASRELKVLFDRLDLAMRRAAESIESGRLASEMVVSMNLPGRREALNESAARARQAQHVLFRSMFRVAEAEGLSKAEIARTWRVSRQLVSRTIREAD